MSTITYGNIVVEGFPFSKIKQVLISHQANEHATAYIIGEIDPDEGAECIKRADEGTGVMVTTVAEDQPKELFYGAIYNVRLDTTAQYSELHLELISTSARTDTQKMNRTFQNTGKTYEEILNSAIGGDGFVDLTITDQPIGSFIIQYNETNWEFIKRMASRFNAPVITNIISKRPHIVVGLPHTNKTYTLETVAFDYGVEDQKHNQVAQNYLAEGNSGVMRQDFSQVRAKSYQYGYLGDKVVCNGKAYHIQGITSKLVDGLLENTYTLAGKTGFIQPVTNNVQCSGRMLMGVVQEVKRDKVKVHFTEIDGGYDAGGTWWFPYSTTYSSSDGSGWYCMPEIGDMVRVFFPSNNEADAFAASSVNVAPLENPRHKSWRAPGGKQILLTDEGLYIVCQHEKIFIDLTQENGINICAEKNINILAGANVNIQAGEHIQIQAKNNILVGTESSYIDIREDAITLGAKQVRIN